MFHATSKAGVGGLDGRLEHLSQRQPSSLVVGGAQSRHRSGHRGRERSDLIAAADHLRPVVVAAVVGVGELEHVLARCRRRARPVIDGHKPPAVGQEHREVSIATEPTADRLDHERRERRGHHRIDRVAALLEHPHPGRDLTGVTGRDRAARVRRHGRTSISVGRSRPSAAVITLDASSIDRVDAASQPKAARDATRSCGLAAVPSGSIPTRSIESEISP